MLTAQVLPEVLTVYIAWEMRKPKWYFRLLMWSLMPRAAAREKRRIFQGGAEKERKKCAAGAMEGENTQTSVDNPFGVQRHVGGTC